MSDMDEAREILARWMLANSFATGHGDTLEDLLRELKWQIQELRLQSATDRIHLNMNMKRGAER